jgi:SAM-dependent methyltransferase
MGAGMTDVQALYEHRFSDQERLKKDRLWEVLCRRFLQRYVRHSDTVLDLACGLGEFSRHIHAGRRIAVDLNPSARHLLPDAVEFHLGPASDLSFLADGQVDVAFSSNFLEHLPNKAAVDAVLREVVRVLKPGGRYVVIQPNIRYAHREYWDFYDHHTPLSHLSCSEAFVLAGLEVEEVIGRFLPFTTKSRVPVSPALLRVYLSLRPLWRLFGKQFLLVGRKPAPSVSGSSA